MEQWDIGAKAVTFQYSNLEYLRTVVSTQIYQTRLSLYFPNNISPELLILVISSVIFWNN